MSKENNPRLTVTLDGAAKLVGLAGIEYKLESGNLFVVRFNEEWRATTEQIALHLNSISFDATLQAFKQASPDDKSIQELKLE